MSETGNKIVVLGGAGFMGRITVRDLFETSSPKDEIVIADYDLQKAKDMVQELQKNAKDLSKHPKLVAVFGNVKDASNMAEVLKDCLACINCVQYQMNLEIMDAALAARCHYVDLGGLYHMTIKQMAYDDRFKAIGKLALLGMGAAPGITNILARYGADKLDVVKEIHCRVGNNDKTKYSSNPALAVSYSLKTILEEFSMEPAVFTKGKFTYTKPMSGDIPHKFPAPVGVVKPMFTIHSEVATLPLSFKDKGVQEVSFKIAFDPEFTSKVRFLRDLGMASHDTIDVLGTKVKPIDVINKVAMTQPPVKQIGKLKQYEVVRTIVKGTKDKKKLTWIVDCHNPGHSGWNLGVDTDTGCPPAIAVQMLALGEITAKGAMAAELCVPPEPFFKHLKKRKMTVEVTKKSGWDLKV